MSTPIVDVTVAIIFVAVIFGTGYFTGIGSNK